MAPRAFACSSSSKIKAPLPSPMTNPERSLSNGMEARFGLLHSVSAFIEVNPPIPSSVTEASEPPVHIISAYPSRI